MESVVKLAAQAGCSKQEFVKRYFSEQGCTLLEEYVHTMRPMRFVCKCGRTGSVSWNKFTTRNNRCGFCHPTGRKKKYTYQEVKELFESRGCALLQDHYKSNKEKIRYRCKCGAEEECMLNTFQAKNYCKHCWVPYAGEKHPNWKPDRKSLDDLKRIKKRCYKALQTCLKLTRSQKRGRTEALLGYTYAELQAHLELHPNWPKVKDGKWHLDHIFPITAFVEHGITDLSIINALDNLQPLAQFDNISKSNDYDQEEFEKWIRSKEVSDTTFSLMKC